MTEQRSGTVAEFDAHVGLGVVRDDDGSSWPFHCTAIADGSRRIETGTRVSYRVTPGLGRWEAWELTPR